MRRPEMVALRAAHMDAEGQLEEDGLVLQVWAAEPEASQRIARTGSMMTGAQKAIRWKANPSGRHREDVCGIYHLHICRRSLPLFN